MDLFYTGKARINSCDTLDALISETEILNSQYLDADMLSVTTTAEDLSSVTLLAAGGGVMSPSGASELSYESGIASPLNEGELFGGALGEGFSSLPAVPPTSSISPTSQQQNKTLPTPPLPSMPVFQQGALPVVTAQSVIDKQCERNRKNAVAARENRRKKKQYLCGLEKESAILRTEIEGLRQRCSNLEVDNERLQTEVNYLKAVISNQSMLSSLLANIPSMQGIQLTTSFIPGKAAPGGERHSFKSSAKRARVDDQSAAGVCLHVANHGVSLEFCAECSLRSHRPS